MFQSGTLTKAELMKYFVAIDRELIRESIRRNKTFSGLTGPDLSELDRVLTDVLKLDLSDEDVERLANAGLGFLKKIGNAIKEAANKVADTAKKVVSSAAQAVKWVATLPLRAVVDVVLKTMKGPVAKAFVYAFIPENSPLLVTNPEVARKRKVQLDSIQKIRKGLSFETEHLMKHIRNAIVSHYKKSPEEVVHAIANKKDREIESIKFGDVPGALAGLGIADGGAVEGIVLAAAGLVTAVGGVVAVFKKKNYPDGKDWKQEIPAGQNVTNDPSYDPGTSEVIEFIKSPIGIGVSLLLGSAVAYGAYKVAS